ncbi:MAG: TrpB-like pyridoxal phosphate-dependent enzyme [Spirochaetes bacterium]|nr:TrpB-like pyridoxal phosphate-dependent enzyme [Spirochaetota bacterium]
MLEVKVLLEDREMPKKWYNVLPELMDLKTPFSPPLDPATKKPLDPSKLEAIFPKALIAQEASMEKMIPIPEDILKVYNIWRPTPMYRAAKLEKALKTPAHIYFKNESVSPPGSHKPNTAVAQVYYNMKEGVKRIATETGAGQWGSALAFACNYFGLKATIYMVKVSYQQKPYRRSMMQVWGAHCIPSPSDKTNTGKAILKQQPDHPGSLGLAISEAVEDAATHDDTKYSLGSVLNHVLLHQTIIGEELKLQLKKVNVKPDILISCVGGGSNFAGLVLPFVPDVKAGKKIRMIAVEPTACPTLTRGYYAYDFGDVAELTPLLKMYTLGHKFIPPKIHAGGLRYHGDAPIICQLVKEGIVEGRAYHQKEAFKAAVTFARAEGFIPAPETAHAIKAVIDEAIKCREEKKKKTIVFNFSGHGHFDLGSYDLYFEGKMEDYHLEKKYIEQAFKDLPKI